VKTTQTLRRIVILNALATASLFCFAQKVKVGYDKGTDFSKFKTYSWGESAMPPTRPALFDAVIGQVELQLEAKGLTKVPKDGDLTITPSGGIDYGFAGVASTPYSPTYGGPPPSANGGMWTGSTGPSGAGTYVTEGTLLLTFVDRAHNKVVWSGSVKQKLDIEQKDKSLELADKAVIKLLKQFPGKK
jgi:Domain of unknown function (DUF4136)